MFSWRLLAALLITLSAPLWAKHIHKNCNEGNNINAQHIECHCPHGRVEKTNAKLSGEKYGDLTTLEDATITTTAAIPVSIVDRGMFEVAEKCGEGFKLIGNRCRKAA